MRVGQGFLQRRRESRAFEEIIGATRPPPRHRQQLRMLAGDHEVVEAEVLHHARDGADVAGLARLDEHDPQSGHRDKLSACATFD